MAYVRSLISERTTASFVVRRFVVETPPWVSQYVDDEIFPRLVEMELHLSRDAADYFRDAPYSLAETIWNMGLRAACDRPFCCTWEDYEVLFYVRTPHVQRIYSEREDGLGRIVLNVTLDDATT